MDAKLRCCIVCSMHVQKWRFRDRWLYVYLMVLVTQDFIAIQHGDKVSQLFVVTSITRRRDNLLEKFMVFPPTKNLKKRS